MPYILNGGPAIGQPFTPLQISTGGKDVIATGTVITADARSVEFQIADVRIALSFENDGGEPKFGTVRAVGATLYIPLVNFNNPLGAGTTTPIEIGRLHGRKLLLAFSITGNGPDSLKTVHYTFLLAEAA